MNEWAILLIVLILITFIFPKTMLILFGAIWLF